MHTIAKRCNPSSTMTQDGAARQTIVVLPKRIQENAQDNLCQYMAEMHPIKNTRNKAFRVQYDRL